MFYFAYSKQNSACNMKCSRRGGLVRCVYGLLWENALLDSLWHGSQSQSLFVVLHLGKPVWSQRLDLFYTDFYVYINISDYSFTKWFLIWDQILLLDIRSWSVIWHSARNGKILLLLQIHTVTWREALGFEMGSVVRFSLLAFCTYGACFARFDISDSKIYLIFVLFF